jgi:hypothetical protein
MRVHKRSNPVWAMMFFLRFEMVLVGIRMLRNVSLKKGD